MKLTRRITRSIASAAVIGLLATAAVGASPASAGFGDVDLGPVDRFDPIDLGDKPCDDETFKRLVCSPDYVASLDASLSYNTYYQGQKATMFLATIHNDSVLDGPDDLNSIVRSYGAREILGFEHVIGDPNWIAYPSGGADQIWKLTSPDGLDAGEFTTVRVYVASWDTQTVAVNANGVWKYDCCGTWFAHDHSEISTTNNAASVQLNPITKK